MAGILNQYICTVPFNYLEIHSGNIYGCCPSWLPISYGTSDNLSEVWNGDPITKVRESVLNGSYEYCNKTDCPHLSRLIHTKFPTEVFILKSANLNLYRSGPSRLNFAFDRSCNFSCPSCRNESVMANSVDIGNIQRILDDTISTFGSTVTFIYLSGACDPFASKTFREFLKTFDPIRFPKLKNIHIHTNGSLLNEELWSELESVHPYIKTIEISIDATTKDTYEKIRRGGKWDTLLSNLQFIATIPTVREKFFDFVVQDSNYKEMESFYKMINKLPHHKRSKVTIYYGKLLNWGTFTDDEFLQKQIWGEHHPLFADFLIELKKVGYLYNSTNNMNDIIEKYKLKPIPSRLI